MSKPLRCRFGWHKWVTKYASDGTTRFLQCRRCPKQAEFELRQWWTGGWAAARRLGQDLGDPAYLVGRARAQHQRRDAGPLPRLHRVAHLGLRADDVHVV